MFDSWQLQTGDEIIDVDTTTLKQWINEGRVGPYHQVRRSGLNWLAAERVPELRPLFPASTTQHQTTPAYQTAYQTTTRQQSIEPEIESKRQFIYQKQNLPLILTACCANHPESRPDFICCECGYSVCKSCAKLVGVRNVPICARCDGLCHEYRVTVQRAELLLDQQSEFGFQDLQLALRHPLNYLFEITLISAFFGGSLLIGFAGFPLGTLLAYAILFTCTSVVIKRVMIGNQDHRHLFDLGYMMADLATPVLLGLAILLITTGPYEIYHFLYLIKVQQTKGGEAFSILFSKFSAFYNPVITPISIILMVWAFCYYPLALLIAGISERFTATINPWEGISLALRLGRGYLKIFGYYLALAIVGAIITAFNITIVIPALVASFSQLLVMPIVNVLIALMLCSLVAAPIFYINIVIAFLLGRALFKNADQFGILIG